jgi:hypothetical protein
MNLNADTWRKQPTSATAYLEWEARKPPPEPPPTPPPEPQAKVDFGNRPLSEKLTIVRRNELRILFRMRDPSLIALSEVDDAIKAAGIDPALRCQPEELGDQIDFTVPEDERFATEPLGRRDCWYKRKGKMIMRRAARLCEPLQMAGFYCDRS